MVDAVRRRLRTFALAMRFVGMLVPRLRVMSMSCSYVGVSCARTSRLCSVGWRSEMNRGDIKCRSE